MQYRYLVQFSKMGRIRFIGHLDLMHVVQRAVNRANLPISYSVGFNPHQIMSFALPLSLGVESKGEYVEFSLESQLEASEITNKLNKEMPTGIQILNTRELEKGEKTVAALVEAAWFEIVLYGLPNIEELIKNTLAQENIFMDKKSKSGMSNVDIRPDIFEINVVNKTQETQTIEVLLSAGSVRNIKPELLVKALYNSKEYDTFKIKYTRLDLLKRDTCGKGFVSAYEKDNN